MHTLRVENLRKRERKTMNLRQTRSALLLMLTALIWGVAFVAQSVGMDYVDPFTFNAVRSLIGGAVLIPCIWVLSRGKQAEPQKTGGKTLWLGGVCCGAALACGSMLQQFGIRETTVGKAGFITALYILIVPLLGLLFHKKVGKLVWLGVALAVGGMYLLCMNEGFSIGRGDLMVLIGSFAFSVHILVIDHFSPKVDGVRMSCIQFFVCGLLCAGPMLVLERPSLSAILAAWAPILYAGVLSCGVAYTLQIIGQRNIDPTVASLLLSLESVFSMLAGWVLLGQAMTVRELSGCALVFCAIILAQLPGDKLLVRRKKSHG